MKAIINGLRYDTDTAVRIGTNSHGTPRDLGRYNETLYRTPRSGRFFLAGEGGPRSHYAVSERPGEWRSGEKITPLSEQNARNWAEKNLSAEEIETGFSVSDA